MGERAVFGLMGALLLLMGVVSLVTSLALRAKRQDWRTTALFAGLGVGVGAALLIWSRG